MLYYAIKTQDNSGYLKNISPEGILITTDLKDAQIFDDFGLAICACPAHFKIVKLEIKETEAPLIGVVKYTYDE